MSSLYQNRGIREIESLVISQNIIADYPLMQRAGQAAFEQLQTHWKDANNLTLFCGKGSNAGDGYVIATLAHQAGIRTTVVALADTQHLSGSALKAAQACESAGVTIIPFKEDLQIHADVIVDAILGSGLRGDVQDVFAQAIAMINAADVPVLSVDVPSGLDVDTGQILGNAVHASVTVTFIGLKQGLFTHKAPTCCGEIVCAPLGVPDTLVEQVAASAELLEWHKITPFLPKRKRDTHKGDCGHVLVIGGDYGMGGAVRMSSEAAMRVGAGLVTVATRPEHVPVVNCSRPEIMCHQVADPADLDPLLERATVIVIGPGLGKSEWAEALLQHVLKQPHPKVLDADALNLLAQAPLQSDQWVLTPHPGEAGRLLQTNSQSVQANRFDAAQSLQEKYHGVVVLKGVGSIIQTGDAVPSVCKAGNPGMASGGMGDVLSGVIGGLLAQGLTLDLAAKAGVLVHSIAADIAADEGGERGLLATDLMQHLRELVNPESDERDA